MRGAPDFYNRRKGFEFGRDRSGPAGVKIERRVGVQAPAAVVWEIIHDVARWPEWNPVYPKAEGAVRIGEALTLTRALPGQPHKVIQPVVLDWTPNELLHLKLSTLGGMALVTCYWEIDALAEASCIFSSGELYTGWLGPGAARSIRGSLRRGFAAVCEAMKARAEAAWRAQGGAPTSEP
ncbi:SRPBCC domain-containing protein [Phenylobacterium sp.]|jgi:hypothetical protein|uniref:SRPBCC domain-containing protein n=1 Tax=Phenylobacterium sp. TaxID=1871053 RepID=UPI002F3EC1E6